MAMKARLMSSASPTTTLRRPTKAVNDPEAAAGIADAAKALVAGQPVANQRLNSSPPAPRVEDDDKKDDDEDDDDSKAEGDGEDEDEDDDDKEKGKAKTKKKTKAAAPMTSHTFTASEQYNLGAADERKKIQTVLTSEAGAAAFKANPDKVMKYLTSFSGTATDAIATLELLAPPEQASAPRNDSLRDRMAGAPPVPNAGPDAGPANNNQMSAVDMILRGDKIRRGEG
jgi:hypothetical protein